MAMFSGWVVEILDRRAAFAALRAERLVGIALCAGLLALGLGTNVAQADGSRDLFPFGYTGRRAALDLQPADVYVGVVRRRTFLYAYVEAGEYLAVGSRNRINNNPAGNIRIYDPQAFGTKGDETIPGTSQFDCVLGATGGAVGPHYFGDADGAGPIQPRGAIPTRLAELAGPRSADNSAGGVDTWAPCAYRAPVTGVYGVVFEVSNGGGGPDAVVDPPDQNNNSVSAWEVAVRTTAASTATLAGRVFTYAFVFFTGGNNLPVSSDLFYATLDGFRYRQEFRGFDPNGYAVYANSFGFLDAGEPLYKGVRGANFSVFPFLPGGSGITAQTARYPAFFVDIDAAGANAANVGQVLTALGIPLAPPAASLDAASFTGTVGSGQTVVNLGGSFTLSTTNTMTYQVVISRDGINFDPGNPLNRVLSGLAPGGVVVVTWDGLDNAGAAFPVGSYPYQVTAHNGEVHFPMIDAEGNINGGPTVTRLNGPGTLVQRRTVFFDDRGYVTSNATAVGVLNGTLCPAGSGGTPPVPAYNLLGVDSSTAYRAWPTNGNSNADCVVLPTTQGFGDAKGLDLWTHVSTGSIDETIEIFSSSADLQVTKTDGVSVVTPGSSTTYVVRVTNAGPVVSHWRGFYRPSGGRLVEDLGGLQRGGWQPVRGCARDCRYRRGGRVASRADDRPVLRDPDHRNGHRRWR